MVLGVIGIPEPIYLMMTMRSIINAVRAYRDEQEQVFQADWERARFVAAWATMKKINRAEDLIKFPWEKKEGSSGFDALRGFLKQQASGKGS